MPDDARMTMNMKMLRVVVAGVASIAAAAGMAISGGRPGTAVTCQRTVAIDPQVTVSEAGRSLTFVVYTGGCTAPGEVSFAVTDGTARRGVDFLLDNGRLQWGTGDVSSRRITATVLNDTIAESPIEYFRVTLTSLSGGVRVASTTGVGRLFDEDSGPRLATVDSRVCLVTGSPEKVGCSLPSGTMSGQPVGTETIEPGHIIVMPVTLNAPNGTDQSVNVDTFDGTLLAGLDYEPVHSRVTIPAGTTVVFVQVRLLPHAFTQNGKYFNVQVSSYTGGGIVSGIGQVTVTA